MSTLMTNTEVLAITDSLAKFLTDYNAALVVGTTSAVTTMKNGTGGTGASNAFLGRNLALAGVPDITSELTLLAPANAVAAAISASLSGLSGTNGVYQLLFSYINALDLNLAGLSAFLVGNASQVNAWYALAHNYFVTQAFIQAFRNVTAPPVALGTAQYFPYAALDGSSALASFTANGATSFSSLTFPATTAAAGGGCGPMTIYRTSGATAGTIFTITYTKPDGTSGTTTHTTLSGGSEGSTLSGGQLIGSGVLATAVTNVVASGTAMTNGDAYVIGMGLVRTPTY